MAEKEREVVHIDDRRGGSTALAVVVLLAILVVLLLVFGRGLLSGGGTRSVKASVDVHGPASG